MTEINIDPKKGINTLKLRMDEQEARLLAEQQKERKYNQEKRD